MRRKIVLPEGENQILDILFRIDTSESLRSTHMCGLPGDRQDPDIIVHEDLVHFEVTIFYRACRRNAGKIAPPEYRGRPK